MRLLIANPLLWLLLIGAVTISFFQAVRELPTQARLMRGNAETRFFAMPIWQRVLVVLVPVLGLTSTLIWLTEDIIRQEDWPFWLQTLAGNWSADLGNRSHFTYSLSAWLAVVLNQASILGIVWLLLRLFDKRRKERVMRLSSIYKSRDISIINSFLASLPENEREHARASLEKSFREGHATWSYRHLPAIFGEKEAASMRDLLEVGEVSQAGGGLTITTPKKD
jgi:hypothetical protein